VCIFVKRKILLRVVQKSIGESDSKACYWQQLQGHFMRAKPQRPLSPHVSIWRWGVHMLVSILNRACGIALALGGMMGLVAWLLAIAGGEASYSGFVAFVGGGWMFGLSLLIGMGLSFAFFFHLLGGLRHFVMDMGAGFELRTNKRWAQAVIAGAVLLTMGYWILWFWG
jgi:succinate dehydrogenase / fumarate reductase, cytochrome b subunit